MATQMISCACGKQWPDWFGIPAGHKASFRHWVRLQKKAKAKARAKTRE